MEMKRESMRILTKPWFLSLVVPIGIFYYFSKQNQLLLASLLSGSWCFLLIAYQWFRFRKTDVLTALSAALLGISLVVTLLFRNPKFFIWEPIAEDVCFGLLFFVTLLWQRPLVQIIAESGGLAFPEVVRQHQMYRRPWYILTLAWGVLSLLQAVGRVILYYLAPLDVYYTVGRLYVVLSIVILTYISYKFPRWYWSKYGSPF